MKQYIMKSNVFVIVIFSFFSYGAIGQTINNCLRLAEQQYVLENYYEVIELYERVAFFGKDSLQLSDYINWADSYRQINDYEKAAINYEIAANLAGVNDSLRTYFFLKVSFCQIMQNHYQESLVTLYNLADSLPEKLEETKLLYTGITSFKLNQFDEAERAFSSYFSNAPYQQQAIGLFKKNKRLERRFNPKKAKVLSILLPGLGQIYYGDTRSGLNSFLLNGALMALSLNYMVTYSFVEGFLAVGPWFQRYYVGGFTRAKKGAVDKIEMERQRILAELLAMVKETK